MPKSRSGLAVAVLAIGLSGCSGTPRLSGAKVDIPVFAPSSLGEEHEATTSDDLSNINKFHTHSWELSTTATWQDVDAFYREKLPGATRDDETSPVADDESPLENEVRYQWVPDGWTGGAKIMGLITKAPDAGKTRFRVSQDVLN